MPQRSGNIENGCENLKPGSPETTKRFLSGKEHNSLEFRAEIIPYDNFEDPSAPILAFSGDNINLIFNIPKENFRKLAVAAMGHLEKDSDFKLPEKSILIGDKERESEMSTKSSVSNVVQDLNVDNNHSSSYEEDRNESCKPKDKTVSTEDKKSCEDSILFTNKPESLSDGSQSTEGGAERSNNAESASVSGDPLNSSGIFTSISGKISDSSNGILLNPDCVQPSSIDEKENYKAVDSVDENHVQFENHLVNDSKMECREDEINGKIKEKFLGIENPEQQTTFDKEQSNFTDQNEDLEEMDLSGYSLGFSYEDCPELETAWPVMEPFTETEKIPVKELKSIKLNGVSTKYLKLEFSSEFVVLRVSSDSNVLVDAVKYKENKANSKPEGSFKESNIDKHNPSEKGSADSFTSNALKKTSVVDTLNQSSIKDSSNLPNQTSDAGNSIITELDIENKDSTSKNSLSLSAITFAAEPFKYGTPIKDFGSTDIQKAIALRLEQKLKEPDENIPGSSPTERFKFILNSYSETEANKQTGEVTSDTSEILDSSEAEISLVKTYGSNDFQILKNDLEDTNSQSEYLNENSQVCSDFHDKIEMPLKTGSLDKTFSNVESGSECTSTLSEKPDEYSSPNKDFELVAKENEDVIGEKSIHSDNNFNAGISLSGTSDTLKPAKIQNEQTKDHSSMDKSNSLEDSGLNNSSYNFKNVSMSTSIQLENKDSEEIDSHSMLESSFCEFQRTEISKRNENKAPDEVSTIGTTKNMCSPMKSLPAAVETTVDAKLESLEDSFEEIVSEKKNLSRDVFVTEGSKLEALNEKLNTDEIILDRNLDNSSEEIKLESSEKSDRTDLTEKFSEIVCSEEKNSEIKHELNIAALESHSSDNMKNEVTENISEETVTGVPKGTVTEISDTEESELSNEALKSSDNESYVEHSSDCIDLVQDITDSEVKQTENSFASNLDSFMNTTVDAVTENSFASKLDSFMNTTVDAVAESMSEGGDIESDDKSVASESDDCKDSEKQACGKHLKKKISETDEVDSAPTRVRRRKVVTTLAKDVIPENSEVKNVKTSKAHGSTLDVNSKNSVKLSPIGRYLRSKSLDPVPEPSKRAVKHKSVVESEEANRRTRAKTPDVISRKDIKMSARSSPRKLAGSSATTESSSASKVQNSKTSATDKSLANSGSSISTSKRNKRGNKD